MPKLLGYKSHHFTSIKSNIDPIADHNSVVKCTNLESHVKPGIFTLRSPYSCKYLTPVDSRLVNPVPISFDNFYEKTAGDPTEVTVQVQSATVKSNISGVTYTLPSPAIWMRPYWDGGDWVDAWQWLNETIITNLVSNPDSTYKNQVVISGFTGSLNQWTAVNITRDSTLPVSILLSDHASPNTTIWISAYNNNWVAGDVIVLMKNYIPIKYLSAMNSVTADKISFHRIPSKLRIGFGGKENCIGLAIQYIKDNLQLDTYSFPHEESSLVGNEHIFANANEMVVTPYTLFNEDNKDFTLDILTASGSFPAGTYYFRLTGLMDGTDEVLLYETSIVTTTNLKFFPEPLIRCGSFSRRLTSLNVYFGQDNGTGAIDYYFFKNYLVSNPIVANKFWHIYNDGTLQFTQTSSIDTNIYTETCSARVTTDNSIGSWVVPTSEPSHADNEIVVTGTTGAYFLTTRVKSGSLAFMFKVGAVLPKTAFASLKSNVLYGFTLTYKATNFAGAAGTVTVSFLLNGIVDSQVQFTALASTSYTVSFNLTSPTFSDSDTVTIQIDYQTPSPYNFYPLDGLSITGFQIIESQTNYLDVGTELGSLDITQMGYVPTLDLVKDWACALVRRGSTFVASAFIEKLYSTLVFFSPVSGDGNPMYDVLIAGNFLDADKDNFRGESIIAMAQLLNTLLLVITEAGGVIIDPDSGETQEVSRGFGIVTKESLRSYRGMLFWASIHDFVATDSSGYTAQAISEDSVRQFLIAVPDNTKLSACIDKYGSYHVALGSDSPIKELVLTKRGWIDQSRTHCPTVMRNGFMDVVWFMDSSGNIFWIPTIGSGISHIALDDTGKIAIDDVADSATDDAGSISAF